jgi:hypothetical protein
MSLYFVIVDNVANLSFNDFGGTSDPTAGKGCGYGQKSADVDLQTREKNILSIISAGNSGGNLTEGCSANYVRTPATAKNGIAVGSTDNFTIAYRDGGTSDICGWDVYTSQQDATRIPSYSAHGYSTPTITVVKPDLVAPSTRVTGPVSTGATGCIPASVWCSYDAGSQTAGFVSYTDSTYNPDPGTGVPRPWYYGLWDGTSFAAPAVSGAAAVVRKWYRNLLGGDPSPAMTKAMLINGARDLKPTTVRNEGYVTVGTVGHVPDQYQGWGMVSFDRLLGSAGSYYFYDQGLALSPSVAGLWQKYLYVVDGGRDLRVTLVWTDPAASKTEPATNGGSVPPGAAINNLDLSVTNSTGTTTWYGNRLDQQGTGFSIPNPSPVNPDAVNNVEQVILPAGTFTSGAGIIVAVTGTYIPSGSQDFAVFIDDATEPATTLTTMTPCRLVDTRNPNGPLGGPALSANITRTFTAWGNCGIPVSAKSIVLNATVTQTGDAGTARLFPGGIQPPAGSAGGVVYYSAGQTRAGNSIISLGGTGTIAARADQTGGTTIHLIIDVVGYYQ